jgi:hypothetical protein
MVAPFHFRRGFMLWNDRVIWMSRREHDIHSDRSARSLSCMSSGTRILMS